jgi:hypothetical protein
MSLGEITEHNHICPVCQIWHLCNGEYCENQVEQTCADCIKVEDESHK